MAESNPVTKNCDHMKNQLRGIALILFGILLAIVGIADELFSAGDFLMILLFAGVLCGVGGIVMTFIKE